MSAKTNANTQRKLAGLGVYDLASGAKQRFIRLDRLNEGFQFCNDIALADDGTLYVTNSFSPVIYRVDTDFEASLLANDERFAVDGFGFNGVALAGRSLLVAHSVNGTLHRVDTESGELTEVQLSESARYADGLVVLNANRVAIAQNEANQIAIFETRRRVAKRETGPRVRSGFFVSHDRNSGGRQALLSERQAARTLRRQARRRRFRNTRAGALSSRGGLSVHNRAGIQARASVIVIYANRRHRAPESIARARCSGQSSRRSSRSSFRSSRRQ